MKNNYRFRFVRLRSLYPPSVAAVFAARISATSVGVKGPRSAGGVNGFASVTGAGRTPSGVPLKKAITRLAIPWELTPIDMKIAVKMPHNHVLA
jgi:hypothetical protein